MFKICIEEAIVILKEEIKAIKINEKSIQCISFDDDIDLVPFFRRKYEYDATK